MINLFISCNNILSKLIDFCIFSCTKPLITIVINLIHVILHVNTRLRPACAIDATPASAILAQHKVSSVPQIVTQIRK